MIWSVLLILEYIILSSLWRMPLRDQHVPYLPDHDGKASLQLKAFQSSSFVMDPIDWYCNHASSTEVASPPPAMGLAFIPPMLSGIGSSRRAHSPRAVYQVSRSPSPVPCLELVLHLVLVRIVVLSAIETQIPVGGNGAWPGDADPYLLYYDIVI